MRASGGGEGTARLTACGQKLRLTAGDAATVTCGPLTLDVFSGPVDIPLLDDFLAIVPSGVSIQVTVVDSNTVALQNLSVSTGNAQVQDGNITVVLEPGALVQLTNGAPIPLPQATPTPTPLPTATPTPTPVPPPTPTLVPTPTPTVVPTPLPGPTPTPTPPPGGGPPTPTPTPLPTATPIPANLIATENWESGGQSGGTGWLDPWTFQGGNDASVTSLNSPFEGTNHLRLQSSDGYVQREVNLSGQTGVHLTFYAKVESLEGSDSALAQVSSDGVNWTTVKTWTSADSDGVYRLVDIDLSGFTMSSQFFVAFQGDMSNNGDRILIDKIQLEN